VSNEQEISIYQQSLPTFEELRQNTAALTVTSETLQFAAESLATAKRIATVLDEERIKVGKPNFDAYKAVNEKYGAIITPCKELASTIEKKIAAYNRELKEKAEREQREYERKVREAEEARQREIAAAEKKRQAELKKAEKKGVEPPPPPAPVAPAPYIPPPAPIEVPKEKLSTTFGSVKIKDKWAFKIVKIEDVPRQWLMVDERKVLAAINQKPDPVKGIVPVRDIAGLSIQPEE